MGYEKTKQVSRLDEEGDVGLGNGAHFLGGLGASPRDLEAQTVDITFVVR